MASTLLQSGSGRDTESGEEATDETVDEAVEEAVEDAVDEAGEKHTEQAYPPESFMRFLGESSVKTDMIYLTSFL